MKSQRLPRTTGSTFTRPLSFGMYGTCHLAHMSVFLTCTILYLNRRIMKSRKVRICCPKRKRVMMLNSSLLADHEAPALDQRGFPARIQKLPASSLTDQKDDRASGRPGLPRASRRTERYLVRARRHAVSRRHLNPLTTSSSSQQLFGMTLLAWLRPSLGRTSSFTTMYPQRPNMPF